MGYDEQPHVILLPSGSPWRGLTVYCTASGLSRLELAVADQAKGQDGAASALRDQLLGYFHNAHQTFTLTLAPRGTPYQHAVWQAIRNIPVGETRSYGQLARALGSASQAVGNACRANPLPILIPCHRVVASTGIGGYFGATEGAQIAAKRWLLHHEGCDV